MTQALDAWRSPQDSLVTHIRGSLLFIFCVIGIGFAIFLLWGLCAPIDSATTARGRVVVHGGTKVIQHPIGGIVSEIHIKDGDSVEKDQVIIRLNRAKEKGELAAIVQEITGLEATRASLAEKMRSSSFQESTLKEKIAGLERLLPPYYPRRPSSLTDCFYKAMREE